MVGVALFGIGRMGTLHLGGILASSNMRLKYIIEVDESRWIINATNICHNPDGTFETYKRNKLTKKL